MRILTFTNLYPNHIQPNRGIFIKHRMDAFRKLSGALMDVIAPVPYFPRLPIKSRWWEFSQIKRQENFDGVKVYHPRYFVVPKLGMQTHGKAMLYATLSLVQRLHEQKPYDLIDAHWVYPDGWVAVKIGKVLDIPVVVSARGNDINEYVEFPKIRRLIKWTLQNSAYNISVCQALKDIMLQLNISESKIGVIGNGVDIERFNPKSKAECRKQLELPVDRKIIISVGLLEPRKGHHILIDALAQLRRTESKLPLLVIVGSGLMRQKLIEQVNLLNLYESVKLVGEVSNAVLPLWYVAADLLCLASDREGWPNVLLEAIACGTPVLATSVYGIPEVIDSSDIGELVQGRAALDFAEQIPDMLNSKWVTSKLTEYAAQYRWENVAVKLADTLELCVKANAFEPKHNSSEMVETQ